MNVKPLFLMTLLINLLFLESAFASSKFELTAGVAQSSIEVNQKFGTKVEDDASVLNVSFGVYRNAKKSLPSSLWGAVIEYSQPLSRDTNLPGNGSTLIFRPVNYIFSSDTNGSVEVYGGIAQFDWKKTANGYVFGSAYRYKFWGDSSGLMADIRYFSDLAYDSVEGDDIATGLQFGFRIYHQF